MTYNEKVETIKGIAETINTAGTFIHGRNSDGSLAYPKPMPQIHLYPFTTTDDSNPDFENSEMLMGFWFQDKPDTTEIQRQAIIEKADVLQRLFIKKLKEVGTFEIKGVRTEPQYRMQAGTLSGYAVKFNMLSQKPNIC